MRNHDLVFLKNFTQIIVFLMVITVLLILAGMYFNSKRPVPVNPTATAATITRIQPAGAVFAGDTGAAAAAAAAVVAAEAAKGVVAYGGTLDGGEIFGQICTGCHTSGAAGAPKLEKSAWTARLAQGNDILHQHAINGIRSMPARGGNPALSDEQVIASVDWMVANLK
ncbi:MAG: cytochrome c5 family protein [Arenimonas sp.]|nr:cytochrome c5 family protein [Arenimonas sp.]